MGAVLKLTMIDGSIFETEKIIGFRCKKERYTPYSFLTVTALAEDVFADVVEVRFEIDGKIVHRGIMDNLSVAKSGGRVVLKLTSKGFSSMLAQNELEPGVLTGISLNTLMSEQVTVPNVTWQDSDETVRYIYVKEHDSQWSAIVSLCLTLNNTYPYIGADNEVRISAEETPFRVKPSKIFEHGMTGDFSKIVSTYHMKDVNDEYTYSYSDGIAEKRGIVRHKYIAYDKQFVALDDLGLKYRLKFTERGSKSRFLVYSGYSGEELCDDIRFIDGFNYKISALEICGNSKKGIFTKVYCYDDGYCNNFTISFGGITIL